MLVGRVVAHIKPHILGNVYINSPSLEKEIEGVEGGSINGFEAGKQRHIVTVAPTSVHRKEIDNLYFFRRLH